MVFLICPWLNCEICIFEITTRQIIIFTSYRTMPSAIWQIFLKFLIVCKLASRSYRRIEMWKTLPSSASSQQHFYNVSQYLGKIQVWRNMNEHHYCLTSTKSVICPIQIVVDCSPFQSLNRLPFHTRLEHLKLIYYNLISVFLNITLKLAHFAPFSYLHVYLPL